MPETLQTYVTPEHAKVLKAAGKGRNVEFTNLSSVRDTNLRKALADCGLPDAERFVGGNHWGIACGDDESLGWFPIEVGHTPYLSIMHFESYCEGEKRWVTQDDVVESWLAIQLRLGKGLRTDNLSRLIRTYDALNSLVASESWPQFLEGVLRCLCSNNGLGWNRAWILEQHSDDRKTAQYSPIAALGELNDAHRKPVSRGPIHGTLAEEIQQAIGQNEPSDSLYQVIRDSKRRLEFVSGHQQEFWPIDPKGQLVAPLLQQAPYPVTESVNEWVWQTLAGRERYTEDSEHYVYVWTPCDRTYLVLLSNPYTRGLRQSASVTTLLLEHLAGVATNLPFRP